MELADPVFMEGCGRKGKGDDVRGAIVLCVHHIRTFLQKDSKLKITKTVKASYLQSAPVIFVFDEIQPCP